MTINTNVDVYKSNISRHNGFSKFSKYRIIFPTLYVGDDIQTLTGVCRQAMFPGKQIEAFQRRTNQKAIDVANGYNVDTAQFSLLETNDQMVTKYMDFWMDMVISPRDYLFSYRDEYARDILMLRIDEQDNVNYALLLRRAYPKSKVLMDYSYDNTSNFAELITIFYYEDYEHIPLSAGELLRDSINAVRLQNLRIPLPWGNSTLGRVLNTGKRVIDGLEGKIF